MSIDNDQTLWDNLRKYPLYDFDVERVRVSAYKLSEKSSDSFLNWLQAEREETRLQSQEALEFATESHNFLLSYDLVDRIRFVSNQSRNKEWRGNRRDKRCVICSKKAPEVTFRTDAHLLPACTGNRFLYTAEECDECNLASGRSTEVELGKMLDPHRAVGRIQTRNKPSTKLRLGDNDSSIGGQGREEALHVRLIENSATVKVRDLDNNSIELSARVAPFRPISALRSLGRTAWHLLPEQLRSKAPELLDWVRTEPSIVPARFVQVTIPGPGLIHTTFCVWAQRPNSSIHGPKLLYLLALANLVLVIPSPEYMTSPYPIPVPPLPKGYDALDIKPIRADRNDHVHPHVAYNINYISRTLTRAPDSLKIRAIANSEGASITLECELTVIESASRQPCYILRGGDLRGQLTIWVDPLRLSPEGSLVGGDSQVDYELSKEHRVGDVALTSRFIETVYAASILSIFAIDAGKMVSEIPLSRLATFDAEALRDALAESERLVTSTHNTT